MLVFALFLTCAACGGGGGTATELPLNGIMATSSGAGAFNAGTGYDYATGLGTVNVKALLTAF